MPIITSEWSNTTPAGVEYTIRDHREAPVDPPTPPIEHVGPCVLISVVIPNSDEFLGIPCLSCSAFDNPEDLYNHCETQLTGVISRAACLPITTPNPRDCCAATVAKDVSSYILRPAISSDTQHIVQILVNAHPVRRSDPIRVVDVVPGRKIATGVGLVDMVKARDELGARFLESGEKWAAEQECPICMEEIESVGESLTPPCCHVFHSSCLVKWLEISHVCPVCRFQLPHERT